MYVLYGLAYSLLLNENKHGGKTSARPRRHNPFASAFVSKHITNERTSEFCVAGWLGVRRVPLVISNVIFNCHCDSFSTSLCVVILE
jgi:hypothetical protein